MAQGAISSDIEVPKNANRYPAYIFYLIALVALIMLGAEVAGYLGGNGTKMAILFGVTILALLAPNIETLTIGKDGIVAALRREIANNTTRVKDARDATVEVDELLNQKIGQIFEELRELRTRFETALTPVENVDHALQADLALREAARFKLPAIKDPDDPQKGRFGGSEEKNGRRLSAVVARSSVKSEWCNVVLTVSTLPGAPELTGKVKFYLHDSYDPNRYTIQAVRGEAKLVFRAWGAFTAGAISDDGKTPLELDLATSENVEAPNAWRKR